MFEIGFKLDTRFNLQQMLQSNLSQECCCYTLETLRTPVTDVVETLRTAEADEVETLITPVTNAVETLRTAVG